MAAPKAKRFICPRHWTLAERLAHYTSEPDARGCRLWLGAMRWGYGAYNWQGRMHRVHRLVWKEANGTIPAGRLVCHKCDVRAYINIDHLWLDTHAANMADMVAKGRQAKGIENGWTKLTPSQVLAIRADLRRQKDIAAEYGVHQRQISRIKLRQVWKHI